MRKTWVKMPVENDKASRKFVIWRDYLKDCLKTKCGKYYIRIITNVLVLNWSRYILLDKLNNNTTIVRTQKQLLLKFKKNHEKATLTYIVFLCILANTIGLFWDFEIIRNSKKTNFQFISQFRRNRVTRYT